MKIVIGNQLWNKYIFIQSQKIYLEQISHLKNMIYLNLNIELKNYLMVIK